MIQSKIADMALRIESSRLLIYKAASLKDAGNYYFCHVKIFQLDLCENSQISITTIYDNFGL